MSANVLFLLRPATAFVAVALAAANPASAADAVPTLEHCARIGAAADRLACYDRLAGRAPPATPPADEPIAGAPTTALAARGTLATADASDTDVPSSFLGRFWELDPGDKRGVFNVVGYRASYVLPLHVTNRINRSPASPTQAPVRVRDFRREEAKFQLSLRTKVAEDVLLPGADLWLGFTQQTFWQVYDGADSRPFRNSDYEPEAMVVVPTGRSLRTLPYGWRWRYTVLGVAHQSNGQSDPLSRSWNRAYVGAGFERGDFSLSARVNRRFSESGGSDDNPDLLAYRGRGELQLTWTGGLQTASLLWRTTFRKADRGALQFEWTYPVSADQPNGLRYYLQAFTGFAETLTDYNFRQTSVGAGFTFLQF